MEKTVKYLYKSDFWLAYFLLFGHGNSEGVATCHHSNSLFFLMPRELFHSQQIRFILLCF